MKHYLKYNFIPLNLLKITQSLAITRYVARKYGLVATEEKSIIRQEMMEFQFEEFRRKIFIYSVVYAKDYTKAKEEFISQGLPEQLELMSKFLSNNDWFIGDKLTYIEFLAWETFDWMRLFSPGSLQNFSNLVAFMKRFEAIPQIKTYHESGKYKNWPIVSPGPPWGYES